MDNILSMYTRNIIHQLRLGLADTPAVLVCGARQTGKSTLVRAVADDGGFARYISFDDLNQLQSATTDPVRYVNSLPEKVVIDEVQYVPELFRSLKLAIDNHRVAGRFLLTGSANVLLLPKLSESLAGRMEILTLWPLSQQEIHSQDFDVISALFSKQVPNSPLACSQEELIQKIFFGGYPEALTRTDERKDSWVLSYVRSVLEKDVRLFADISDLSRLPRLLNYLAAQSATILNISSIANAVDIPYVTLNRYMAYLQATYVCLQIPAWHSNLGLRLVKAPKLLISDTGLATSLMGMERASLRNGHEKLGALLETFVGMELVKLLSFSKTRANLFHFRTHDRKEIDFLIERRDGQIVAIEVKANSTIKGTEHRVMKQLKEKLGDRFSLGLVVYTGSDVLTLGERLYAVPVSFLWSA
jgi:uncharacterized protein